jgi:branched-chain amino acid transport system substrate-binding protein
MRAARAMVAVVAAAVLISGIGPRAGAAEPYPIYTILSLTGLAAFIGKGEEQTLKAAESVINGSGGIHGRPVQFEIQDDQSNPAVAVQLFNAILAKGVPVQLGPSLAGPCSAVAPLVKTQIVNYCFSPALHPPAGSYSFSGSASTVDLVATALRYFKAKGIRKLAMLQTTDASGQDGEQVINEDLKLPEFADLSVVDAEHFAPNDVSVDAQVLRIKNSGAQAIIAWLSGPPFGTICRSVANAGLDVYLMSSAGNVSYAQIGQYKSFLPKNTLFISPRFIATNLTATTPVKRMQEQYFKAMASVGVPKPDVLQSVAWNPVFVVVDALRKLPENASAQQVHDYIERMQGFPGINGPMNYRDGSQRGESPDSALVVRYEAEGPTFVAVSKPGGAPL